MFKSKFIAIIFLLGVCFTGSVSAEMKTLIFGSLHKGGDDLVRTTGEDLEAGGGLYFALGLLSETENSNIAYQFLLGYKFNIVLFEDNFGNDGDATIDSFPLEFTAYFKEGRARFGGGIAYHISPEFEFCDSFCSRTKFDDALGFIIEGVYHSSGSLFLSLKYTSIDYEVGNTSIDASNFGLGLGMVF